jgi:hypothetical protein
MMPYRVTKTIEAAERFRDAVNDRDYATRLESDRPKWHQLCAAMDALTDTAMAVAAFSELPPTEHKGELYLRTYGLLQCLFVQQDAVLTAAAVLGAKCDLLDRLGTIRDMRNATIGHPAKKTRGVERGSFGIVQATLEAGGFEWYPFDLKRWEAGERPRPVVFAELIAEQERVICETLEQLVAGTA